MPVRRTGLSSRVYRETVPGPVLPSDLDGCHALALPAGADVRALAVAWFAGGLWEVFIGGWLIAKGFNASAFVPQETRTSNLAEPATAHS